MNNKLTFSFDDVSLVPVHSTITSRKEPNTNTLIGNQVLKIPIVASPMNTITEHKMSNAMSELGADSVIHRYLSIEREVEEFNLSNSYHKPWVAVGATGDFLERAEELFKNDARKFCVDVANGHSEACLSAVKTLRYKFGDNVNIMAGNVCTGEGTKNLCRAGANVIRVGVGNGSLCSTRLVTGFGVPQLTAIEWCVEAADVEGASVVADGGLRSSGDIIKALACGADAVIVGSLLAGTDETPGELIKDIETGTLYKYYHGMASEEGRKEWFSKNATSYVPEGASTKVAHKGSAKKIVEELNNAIKVGMSFANAKNLLELRANAQWVRVTDNGRKEGTVNRKLFK